jgi:DNA-binding response OmpR family regulator
MQQQPSKVAETRSRVRQPLPSLTESKEGAVHVLVAVLDGAARAAREAQLESAGFRVSVARTGFETIVKASCHLPDLIVLDASLGKEEIAETSRLLANCPTTSHIPIVRVASRRSLPRRILAQLPAAAL